MGLEDLQRASVGPTVWKNKVHRHAALGVDSPLPFVEQAFGGDFEPGNRMRTAFHYVHFIPGGRYLISTSEMLITLWDLGPPVPALRHGVTPKAVSTFFAEGSGWKIIKLSPPIIQSHSVRFGVVVSDWANTKITSVQFPLSCLFSFSDKDFADTNCTRLVHFPRIHRLDKYGNPA